MENHTRSPSWFHELRRSADFRKECLFDEKDERELKRQLKFKTVKEKVRLLRYVYPTTYVVFLRTTGQEGEFKRLYDGTITPYNYTWFIHAEIIPKLIKLRQTGKLRRGKLR